MKCRILLILALALTLTLGFSSLASANNDGRVPADERSGNPVAVGQPPDPFGATNATDIVDLVTGRNNPVDAPASANNPGASTGARGEEMFELHANAN